MFAENQVNTQEINCLKYLKKNLIIKIIQQNRISNQADSV